MNFNLLTLIKSLLPNGDLPPNSIVIAFPKNAPSAKDIYVVSAEAILHDSDDIRTMPGDEFHEICH